jgi:FMN reductase
VSTAGRPSPSSESQESPTVVALCGNPRPGSRTLRAAEAAAERIARLIGAAAPLTIDLADFAPEILCAEHSNADVALKTLAGSTVAVIATPVYKASYTGLLKSFLDLYGSGGLAGVVAVPLVLSASPAHSFAGEVHLRPLLVELGAVVATPAVALVESQLSDLETVLDSWVTDVGTALKQAVTPSSDRRTPVDARQGR